MDWFPEECYWSGLDEAPSGTCEYYRAALRYINGDSPFAQPPLKVVEVGLQVAGEQRRLAGHGYDGRVICVKSQLEVVGWRTHVAYILIGEEVGNYSTLSHASMNAMACECGCLERRRWEEMVFIRYEEKLRT